MYRLAIKRTETKKNGRKREREFFEKQTHCTLALVVLRSVIL